MNKDEQIEEMAKEIHEVISHNLIVTIGGKILGFNDEGVARELFDDGYRKSTELAEEIFAEMREELVRYIMLNENIAIKCKEENGEWNAEYWKGKLSAFKQIRGYIDAELKKKYESEKDNG